MGGKKNVDMLVPDSPAGQGSKTRNSFELLKKVVVKKGIE